MQALIGIVFMQALSGELPMPCIRRNCSLEAGWAQVLTEAMRFDEDNSAVMGFDMPGDILVTWKIPWSNANVPWRLANHSWP